MNQTIRAGEAAVFAVEAFGNNLRCQWNINRHDGRGWTLITGATGAEYVSWYVGVADNANEYHCLITDGEGHTVSTKAASLYVYDYGGTNNNNPNGEDAGRSSGGGGCEVSGSWALMMAFTGVFLLAKRLCTERQHDIIS